MDLIQSHVMKGFKNRAEDVVYSQSNCDGHEREHFWDLPNLRLRCSALSRTTGIATGKCNGYKKLGLHKHDFEMFSAPFDFNARESTKYTFDVTMEHNVNKVGYITEKVFGPLLGGSIPIYGGASQITEMLQPGSFVNANRGHRSAVKEVLGLLSSPGKLHHMQQTPALSDEAMRRFFSWHPSVWPTHGDSLRLRILQEILNKCTDLESLKHTHKHTHKMSG
jgi:hypothetical protein